MECNLMDSREIFETLILTRLNLVQILWPLVSLLQNYSWSVAYWQVYACKSNGHLFRPKSQLDAFIKFAYILVGV